MANKSIEIQLVDPSEAAAVASNIVSELEINSDDNEAKTTYTDNDAVKVRFYTSSDAVYTFGATLGTVSKIGSNIQFEQIDYLSFIDTLEENLSHYPVAGSVVYEWVGVSLGNVTFDGVIAKINAKGYGILKVTYQTKYDLLQHVIPKINDVTKTMVWVKQAETSTTQDIEYTLRENQVGTAQTLVRRAPFELTVLDYSTGATLPGVRVLLNGMYKGYTGADGKIFLGNLAIGHYRLKMSKTGYFTSDADGLNNDNFEIVFADTELINL
jgi:hypothetical protein